MSYIFRSNKNCALFITRIRAHAWVFVLYTARRISCGDSHRPSQYYTEYTSSVYKCQGAERAGCS